MFPALDGKVALVTGAVMDMGEATARRFPEAGAKVAAAQLSLLGRFGQPEEVARATLWLASGQSSSLTGTTVHVDAGYTSR